MQDDTATRLESIQKDLAAILEARLAELTDAMKKTEHATRRIVAAEVELERHHISRLQLESELITLESDLKTSRSSAEEVRVHHTQLSQERDLAVADLQKLERETRELDSEVELARQQARDLESTAETLRRENAALKSKLKTMEENIARLRQMQKELMSSMSEITQPTGFTGGDKS